MKTLSYRFRACRRLLGAALILAGWFSSCRVVAATVELIPRQLLFGNPTRTSPQLNSDGSMLAFLAPREGVMNLWVCPVGKLEEARPLTAEKTRPLRSYGWSRNGSDLLFIQDA